MSTNWSPGPYFSSYHQHIGFLYFSYQEGKGIRLKAGGRYECQTDQIKREKI
jgi:hypothetical protein